MRAELGEGQETLYPDDEDGLSREEILTRDDQLERAIELVRD